MNISRPEEQVQHELIQGAIALGYEFVDRPALNEVRAGHPDEPIVVPHLIAAIERLNPGLEHDEAVYVAEKVRRLTDSKALVDALRYGLNLAIPGKKTVDARLVDLKAPQNNQCVVTEEFELRTGGMREPRLDTVFLINGLPLKVVENKAPGENLAKGARDLAGYWEDAPALPVFAVLAGICNGSKFRVGASGAAGLSGYSAWKDTYPHARPEGAGEMETVLLGVCHPATLVDLAAHYVVYETRDGVTTKKLARYQQYRAAEKIVRRIVDGTLDRGIVWHTQGSGKSLTMVFAARKLMSVGLKNPTVLIVVDRTDLDEQINDTLTACEFDGVARAESRKDLKRMLGADKRGVIVTTVHKFSDELAGISTRENVIAFVDEGHRSHEGDMGIWMRRALAGVKLFAFTGTPIENGDRSTRKAFSPEIDGKYEDYLDAYRIKEAIDDGATVPIIYEPRVTDWAVRSDEVDESFEQEFAELNEEQREALRQDAAKLAVVAKTPERVAAIAEDVADYLRERTAPQGFKAQLVGVDREACVRYAEQLSQRLQPDEFAVIFSRAKKDTDRERAWYASAQLKRLGDQVAAADGDDEPVAEAGETEADALALSLEEKKAVKRLIKRFQDHNDPLRLLIVNNMLLTGFDAPIEQVMFLDRGLSGHNLLQAIARTNRPYPGKDRGIIVDYWGVFSQLEKALKMFSHGDVAYAVMKIDELRERFPIAVAEALALVAGFPAKESVSKQSAWLLARLERDGERARNFNERVKIARSIYESLAPDPVLADHLADYRRLMEIHTQWRVAMREDVFDPAEYRPKTVALVQEAMSIGDLARARSQFRIDGEFLTKLGSEELTAEEKAAEIESALVHEIKVRGEHDPVARSLAARLRELTERKRAADKVSMDLLKQYEQLTLDYAEQRDAHKALGLSERAYALMALAQESDPELDQQKLIVAMRNIEHRLHEVADFAGWEQRDDVLQGVRKSLIKELAGDPHTRPLLTSGYVDEAIQTLTARANDQPHAAESAE